MNKLQQAQVRYLKSKKAYDDAFKKEDWDLVDELEDPYLEAEFDMMDEVFEVLVSTGGITMEDCIYMRRNTNSDQWEKMVNMGVSLQA